MFMFSQEILSDVPTLITSTASECVDIKRLLSHPLVACEFHHSLLLYCVNFVTREPRHGRRNHFRRPPKRKVMLSVCRSRPRYFVTGKLLNRTLISATLEVTLSQRHRLVLDVLCRKHAAALLCIRTFGASVDEKSPLSCAPARSGR